MARLLVKLAAWGKSPFSNTELVVFEVALQLSPQGIANDARQSGKVSLESASVVAQISFQTLLRLSGMVVRNLTNIGQGFLTMIVLEQRLSEVDVSLELC